MENKNLPAPESKYAIFQTGGKQYQALIGKTLAVEKLEGNDGDTLTFNEVLLVKNAEGSFEFGRPYVANANLKATIVKQTKGPKLVVFRFKRRTKSRVKNGHRQPLTVIRIESF